MNASREGGEELAEEALEAAERDPGVPAHAHQVVAAEDGTLLEHLRRVHGVDAGEHLSPATQEGVHDRVHGSTRASDD